MKKVYFSAIISTFFLSMICMSCIDGESYLLEEVEGFKPIYVSAIENEIQFQPAKGIEEPGKIYVFGSYLFINEKYEGVHIINNADPRNPINRAFISIPGNVDIAVHNNVLYDDNYNDLVAIDLSDINNLKVCDREVDVFSLSNQYPDAFGIYFECVDNSKGIVVGWERATLHKPKCSR